jgi:hypothetical protein
MATGIDSAPSAACMAAISKLNGVQVSLCALTCVFNLREVQLIDSSFEVQHNFGMHSDIRTCTHTFALTPPHPHSQSYIYQPI